MITAAGISAFIAFLGLCFESGKVASLFGIISLLLLLARFAP